MPESNIGEEPKIIKTQDENGEVFEFELIDIVEYEGQEYGLLVYVDKEEDQDSESDEEEVIIMKLGKENDAYVFETIEEDEEFQKLIEYINSEENDDDFDDDEDEEE